MSDRTIEALRAAEIAIESVLEDEQTQEAGLWHGELLPRSLRLVKGALEELGTASGFNVTPR
jgi:hypothetical protein